MDILQRRRLLPLSNRSIHPFAVIALLLAMVVSVNLAAPASAYPIE
ncbi:MAG: hypothetical protein JO360_07185 [Acidobacteria bacterium]|nr:hypothetical protein [Acidobacteriota bacterium]